MKAIVFEKKNIYIKTKQQQYQNREKYVKKPFILYFKVNNSLIASNIHLIKSF